MKRFFNSREEFFKDSLGDTFVLLRNEDFQLFGLKTVWDKTNCSLMGEISIELYFDETAAEKDIFLELLASSRLFLLTILVVLTKL